MLLFGMDRAEQDGIICRIDPIGRISYTNINKFNTERESGVSLNHDQLKQLGRSVINNMNRLVASSSFAKGLPMGLISEQYLKEPIVRPAYRMGAKVIDHYLLNYSFQIAPFSGHDPVPLYDCALELRIDTYLTLIGFYCEWMPLVGSVAVERSEFLFQDRSPLVQFDEALDEPTLVYRYHSIENMAFPCYTAIGSGNLFFIPASRVSDPTELNVARNPISSGLSFGPIADRGEIDREEQRFEIAIALSDNNPAAVEGFSAFKQFGQYYNPFKWYNYRSIEQPGLGSGRLITRPGVGVLPEVNGFVFYDTPVGNQLFSIVQLHSEASIPYLPEENRIRAMLQEAGAALFVPNTELGGLNVGNFDFTYDGYKLIVVVRVIFSYADGITQLDRVAFRTRFINAISKYWTSSGYGLIRRNADRRDFLPLNVYVHEVVSEAACHKVVDVHLKIGRPKVVMDIDLGVSSDAMTIAHEFGHVIGLYDEYESDWAVEQEMWWKHNEYNYDKSALMNIGDQMRDRYFEHIRNAVAQFDSRSSFQIARL